MGKIPAPDDGLGDLVEHVHDLFLRKGSVENGCAWGVKWFWSAFGLSVFPRAEFQPASCRAARENPGSSSEHGAGTPLHVMAGLDPAIPMLLSAARQSFVITGTRPVISMEGE
jgi:hypothetical protein